MTYGIVLRPAHSDDLLMAVWDLLGWDNISSKFHASPQKLSDNSTGMSNAENT
jgi:hypothetical protein